MINSKTEPIIIGLIRVLSEIKPINKTNMNQLNLFWIIGFIGRIWCDEHPYSASHESLIRKEKKKVK